MAIRVPFVFVFCPSPHESSGKMTLRAQQVFTGPRGDGDVTSGTSAFCFRVVLRLRSRGAAAAMSDAGRVPGRGCGAASRFLFRVFPS